MSAALQYEETPYFIDDHLFDESLPYLRELVLKRPGIIEFSTGAGHIFFDLIKNFPSYPGMDVGKNELCHLVEEHAYPLAASLFAQAVNIRATISPGALGPPQIISALSTFTAFDSITGHLHHGFLSPHHAPPDFASLSIISGLIIECRPLNYHYHELYDDKARKPYNGTTNFPGHEPFNRYKDPLSKYDDLYTDESRPFASQPPAPHYDGSSRVYESKPVAHEGIMPSVASISGGMHTPGYVRMVNVHAPAAKPHADGAAPAPKSPQHSPVYLHLPAPGMVPAWVRG